MVRNDAETVFQQIRELGMTGKGWVWIASDGATTLTFDKQKDLETAMQGMLGIQPKRGEGSLFLRFRAAWMENAQPVYPGKVGDSLGTITLTLFFFYGKGKHCMVVSSRMVVKMFQRSI